MGGGKELIGSNGKSRDAKNAGSASKRFARRCSELPFACVLIEGIQQGLNCATYPVQVCTVMIQIRRIVTQNFPVCRFCVQICTCTCKRGCTCAETVQDSRIRDFGSCPLCVDCVAAARNTGLRRRHKYIC